MRRVLRAWREAERVLAEHAVRKPPVDVHRIAAAYAEIVEKDLDDAVSGVLIPLDGKDFIIVVNAGHSLVRQRFTVAHELGHLLIHSYTIPHADRSFRFRDARSSEGSAVEEIQANQFAAELLMPRFLLLREPKGTRFGHVPETEEEDDAFQQWVENLAGRFRVSRQAMTIRLSTVFA